MVLPWKRWLAQIDSHMYHVVVSVTDYISNFNTLDYIFTFPTQYPIKDMPMAVCGTYTMLCKISRVEDILYSFSVWVI